MDRGAWRATVHGVGKRVKHKQVTEHQTRHTKDEPQKYCFK